MKKRIVALFLFCTMLISCAQQRISISVTRKFDVRDNMTIVQLTLNGKPAYFFLDTGAGATLLDGNLSREYGFSVLPYYTIGSGIGGDAFHFHVDSVDLKIGEENLRGEFLVGDLYGFFDTYEKVTGREIVGILGNDILVNHNVKIDYWKRTVTFSNFTPR